MINVMIQRARGDLQTAILESLVEHAFPLVLGKNYTNAPHIDERVRICYFRGAIQRQAITHSMWYY
ncbi:hypothetical protein P029_03550 [Anaplasma phagocytophilum str. Norway variant2]|uniref:Uncharacterized protein n=1 Tax=Anaplasma phagocytophilum str. Norway variant2 TaxID=1392507 RepID=A0A161HX30_ANAPH|nr:hypothetical protein P029_03550 [Anaplasma phagocytophilum str. Norway variant2]